MGTFSLVNFLNHPLTVISFLLLIGFAIWKISAWKTSIENKLDNLQEGFFDLKERFTGLEQRFTGLEQRFTGLEGRFTQFTEEIRATINNAPNRASFARGNSPLDLNERGKEVSQKIDLYSLADRYTDGLIEKAKEQAMNAYQIEQMCLSYAYVDIPKDLRENDKPQYDLLANVAYVEKVPLNDLLQALGLIIRNKVLKAVGQPPKDFLQHYTPTKPDSKEE